MYSVEANLSLSLLSELLLISLGQQRATESETWWKTIWPLKFSFWITLNSYTFFYIQVPFNSGKCLKIEIQQKYIPKCCRSEYFFYLCKSGIRTHSAVWVDSTFNYNANQNTVHNIDRQWRPTISNFQSKSTYKVKSCLGAWNSFVTNCFTHRVRAVTCSSLSFIPLKPLSVSSHSLS